MSRVFALDPSLTAIGYCVAEVEQRSIDVVSAGRVVTRNDEKKSMVARVRNLLDGIRGVSFERAFGEQAFRPEIVIEVPSGRTTMRHGGGGYGLAKYGFAVGSLHQMLEMIWGEDFVHAVDESTWTGSRSKKQRKEIALQHYPSLGRIKDPGMDVSDAVALAVWWAQVGRHKYKGADA